jgi:hypothetical protein
MTGKWLTVCCFAGVVAFAQPGREDVRRAEIRGGGGPGKCTIEVVVDGVAEVTVQGDSARLRTLSGRPAQIRRFICNQPMPPNPADFRFQGVDGRGRQDLVRDPSRGGTAVVHIEDPQGGSEGYTFDLMWNGDARGGRDFGDNRGGGRDFGDGRGGDRDFGGPQRDREFGGGGWRGARGSTFTYHGDGRGFFNRRNGRDLRVRDVNVSLGRDGRVVVEFDAEGMQRLFFAGRATNYSREYITAELGAGAQSRDVRANASIYVDPSGQVDHISMEGVIDGDPFRLNWRAR